MSKKEFKRLIGNRSARKYNSIQRALLIYPKIIKYKDSRDRTLLHHVLTDLTVKPEVTKSLVRLILRFMHISDLPISGVKDSSGKSYEDFCGKNAEIKSLFTLSKEEFTVSFFIYSQLNGPHNILVRGTGGSLSKFRQWRKKNNWKNFSSDVCHYDWFMFPLGRIWGKGGKYGKTYVLHEDESEVELLKNSKIFMKNYLEGVSLMLWSLGWDIHNEKVVKGVSDVMQRWDRWSVRVQKVMKSLITFSEFRLYSSVLKYYNMVRHKVVNESKYQHYSKKKMQYPHKVSYIKALVCVADGSNFVETKGVMSALRKNDIDVHGVRVGKRSDVTVLTSKGKDYKQEIDLNIDDMNSSFDLNMFHVLVIPGGNKEMMKTLEKSKNFRRSVLHFQKMGKFVCAICSAPVVLVRMGMLEKIGVREITFFPKFEGEIENGESRIKFDLGKNVVVDEDARIVTGRSVADVDDFCNAIIRLLCPRY